MKTIAAEVVDNGERKDVRGRRLIKAQEREALVAAYEQSGLTQRAFAQREGIKFCTFTTWLARKRAEMKPVFAEVKVPKTRSGLLEVVLTDGVTIRGSDPEQVAVMVSKLRRC